MNYEREIKFNKDGCKPFGLHQSIRICHIKLLLKLIIKSIHHNIPSNISTNKKTSHISRFPKISIPLQLLCLQPILVGPLFIAALPHQTSVCHCTTSLDLCPPPHYLIGPRWFVLVLNIDGFCYILIDLAIAIFWYLHGLSMLLFWNKGKYGFDPSRDLFIYLFFVVVVSILVHAILVLSTSLFEFFHYFHSLMHIWKFKLIDIG